MKTYTVEQLQKTVLTARVYLAHLSVKNDYAPYSGEENDLKHARNRLLYWERRLTKAEKVSK
jgi:hypothetical protein